MASYYKIRIWIPESREDFEKGKQYAIADTFEEMVDAVQKVATACVEKGIELWLCPMSVDAINTALDERELEHTAENFTNLVQSGFMEQESELQKAGWRSGFQEES